MILDQSKALRDLAPTLEPLCTGGDAGDIRATIDRLAAAGFRHVQLSATQPGMRPRDLDRSGRKDLLATMRRRELMIAGLDMWIPPDHFLDASRADRAMAAMRLAIELAADLGRVPISFALPASKIETGEDDPIRLATEAIAADADRFGVGLADHAVPVRTKDEGSIGIGIDPPAWLSQGSDPAIAASSQRVVSARLCDLLTTGMRGPIGNRHLGRLDALAYKVALSVGGYSRPLVLDARQWVEPWQAIESCKEAWNRLP